jgi:hypothetical protein
MEKQSFGMLFRRGWERGKELKFTGYTLVTGLLCLVGVVILLAAVAGAICWIEWPERKTDLFELNPALNEKFAPGKPVKFDDGAELTFASRQGDEAEKVVFRRGKDTIHAGSAHIRLRPEAGVVTLILSDCRDASGKPHVDTLVAEECKYTFPADLRKRGWGDPPKSFLVRLLLALGVIFFLWLLLCWVMQMLNTGWVRELLYPTTRIGRGIRSGFARWRTILYLVPWLIACAIVGIIRAVLSKLLPAFPGLSVTWGFMAVEMAMGMVSFLLCAGIAAGAADIGFETLYRNAFRAFKNGWGRQLLLILIAYGVALASMLLAAPGAIALFCGVHFENRAAMIGGGVWMAVWLIVMILVWLRAMAVLGASGMYLYLDASGVAPELDGDAPAAAPEGIPPAGE